MNFLWSFFLCTIFSVVLAEDCTVQDLELYQSDRVLTASWTVEGSPDNCDFEITISSNAESQDSTTVTLTGETSYAYANLVPCSTVTVSVSSGDTTTEATLIADTDVTTAPVLTGMTTSCDSIQMLWEAQPYAENMCQVTHFQLFCLSDTHNFTLAQAVSDVYDRNFDILISGVLRADIYYTCNGFIFITLGGFSAASDNIEFWSNLDSVRDLQLTENDNSLVASWEAPLNSDECGVAYSVTYENEVLGTSSVEVVGLTYEFDIDLISCTTYNITVTPISYTGSSGTAVSDEITPSVRVGDITELTATDDTVNDQIVVSWNAADVGQCDVAYQIIYSVNDEVYKTEEISDTASQFGRIPCSVSSFSIQPISEGVSGNIQEVTLELTDSDITWIGEVTNFRLEDDQLAWEAPSSIGFCSISYVVIITNFVGSSYYTASDTTISVDLIPCSENNVSISGISSTVAGTLTVFGLTAPSAEFSSPIHIRTEPDNTSANITLQADSFENNACDIGTVEVECTDASGASIQRSIAIVDDTTRVFTVELEDLEFDTVYNCDAAWQNSNSGDEFSFKTRALVGNSITVSNIGRNGFDVSWTENYAREFVTGYTLIIETVGPLHSIRSDCEVERNIVRTYQFESDGGSLEFAEGFPDFEYSNKLHTSYSLGVDVTSEAVSVRTATGVPDVPYNLLYSIDENSGSYSANAALNWLPPCALNGNLEGFSVTVVAKFEFGGVEQILEYSEKISGDEVDASYNYVVENLNPFFTYEVSVATVAAAVQGDSETLTIEAPSACSCQS